MAGIVGVGSVSAAIVPGVIVFKISEIKDELIGNDFVVDVMVGLFGVGVVIVVKGFSV